MSKSTKGRVATQTRVAKKAKTRKEDAIDEIVQERLAAVSVARTATAPNKPVKIALLEGERLSAGLGKHRKPLLTLPGFQSADLTALPALLRTLEGAERSWSQLKLKQGSALLGPARKQAEAWRREAMAAARYLLRRDAEAIAEVERIAEGEGLADLVQDLDDLASLIEQHAAVFASLPAPLDVAEAKKLAATLRKGRDDSEANAALELRNRAFWALEDVVTEIRAALRFMLRDDPKKVAPLLSRYETDRRAKRRRAASAANGAVSKPVTDVPA